METNTTILLNDTMNQLFKQAARDGITTDAERNIINQVEIDLKRYIKSLELAVEDGYVDTDEKKELSQIVTDIEDGAFRTMCEDGTINRNESDLLLKLQKILKRNFI